MERSDYLRQESWDGSFYEISLELGPCGDDDVARRALETLWRQPELRGPWRKPDDFGRERVTVSVDDLHLYGTLRLDDGTELGCMSYLVRVAGESDWLDLSIPTGMLELQLP